ncbi:MAG: glycosyltransferase family 4 protein [Elusimicrobia bacterium]|nr:glycosyltransferase family 4 protein [Elusimicrobiota bacterium]
MKSDKLLLLVTELEDPDFKGGIQVFNQSFVKALAELHVSFSILALNDWQKRNVGFFGKLFRQVLFGCKTFVAVYRHKPDLIICGHVGFSSLCFFLQKLQGIPFITITYGVDVWSLTRIKKMALAASKNILSISNYTRNRICSQLPNYPQKQILLFPTTFDAARFAPGLKSGGIMKKLGIRETDAIVLSVSRLSKSEGDKGCEKIISSVKELVLKFPDLKYVAGGSGDDLPRLRRLVRDHGLGDKILFPGFIPDSELPDYYNLCDLFILPSKKEGFGIVFLEALGCGKPVIAGNRDGSVDAVLGGELGLLIDPDSIAEIKDAIVRVLTKNIPKNMLDKDYLRSRVVQAYGFDSFKNRLEAILS